MPVIHKKSPHGRRFNSALPALNLGHTAVDKQFSGIVKLAASEARHECAEGTVQRYCTPGALTMDKSGIA
jgi:hypothetical protein